ERHITLCLESLLKQDQADIEIIVVDDGSRDNTSLIVEKYVGKHPDKIQLIKLDKNKGLGAARNIGAQAAKGEVLLFLDADMIFPTDFVRRLVQPILRGGAVSTVHSEEHVANVANPWVRVQGQTKKAMDSRAGEFFRAIRREVFLTAGGFDPSLNYHSDRTFYYKTGRKAQVVDAHCYHNNPDTAREIFRRNYLIGRTYLAVAYAEKGFGGVAKTAAVISLRLVDVAAIPLFTAAVSLQPTPQNTTILAALPLMLFIMLTFRMKIIQPDSVREKLVLRLFYAPAYRLLRAAGILAGVAISLVRGLKVRQFQQPPNHARQPSPSPPDNP
ncbi:MAG: glycosyltransferase, partial [Candidatus Caldarchaeum sp.]